MPSGVPIVAITYGTKPWWKSRTLWLNIVVLALAAAEAKLQILQPVLKVDVYTWLSFVLPLLNVALRSVTAQPLTLGQQPTAAVTQDVTQEPKP